MATKPDWLTAQDCHRLAAAGPPVDATVRKGFVLERLEELEQPRRLRFIISTGDVDRDNDTIDPTGWELTNFKANPVVLWAHSHRDLPVARAIEIGVEAGKLVAVAEFAPHAFAETVLGLLRGGFLRATSVGFRALEWSMNEERHGVDFKRQELLEFSIVPVPANQNALMAASAAGVDLEPLRKWMADLLADWPGELKLPGKAWAKVLGAAAKHAGEAPITQTVRVGEIESIVRVDTEEATARVEALSAQVDRLIATADVARARIAALAIDEKQPSDCPMALMHLDEAMRICAGQMAADADDAHAEMLHHMQASAHALDAAREAPKVPADSDGKGVSPRDATTDLAARDDAWSPPTLGDFTREPWADLTDAVKRRIAGHFAWAAEMPPAAFGSLKLPHHRASDGKVVWRGVVAAAGRLNQTDLPSADLGAVKAHLRRHYAAFDQEPPEILRDASDAVLEMIDVDPFVLEIADAPDTFEVDLAALGAGLREAVGATIGVIVKEATLRELNRIRGRVD